MLATLHRPKLVAAFLFLALAGCSHSDTQVAADCKPVLQPRHESSGGGVLPMDFPIDVHLPQSDYVVLSVNDQVERVMHVPKTANATAAEINAGMSAAGWAGSLPGSTGQSMSRGVFTKGCRSVEMSVKADSPSGGASLALSGFGKQLEGCRTWATGPRGNYPVPGEFTIPDGFPSDVYVPPSATPSGPLLQDAFIDVQTNSAVPALFQEFADTMLAACWSKSGPNKLMGYPTETEFFSKSGRLAEIRFWTDDKGTRVSIQLTSLPGVP
jgi:hypothetical protein